MIRSRASLFAALCALALAAYPGAAALAAEPAQRTITVQGQGEALTVPDIATISIGVSARAATAIAAMEEATAVMNRMFERLAEAVVEPRDVQTGQLSLSPIYRHEQVERVTRAVPDGFEARNTVFVRVRDIARTGAVIDQLVQAGANDIQNIAFSVAEPEPLLDEARRKAVADARRKAELLAAEAGVELGQVISIDESGGHMPPPMPMARMEAMDAAIAPGEQKLTVQVTMVWGLL